MIRVSIERTASERVAGGKYVAISVLGHASREAMSTDGHRVCAAISTLAVTMQALGVSEAIHLESGEFQWEGEESPHVEFFMKAMELLAHSYPEYVSLYIR